MNPFEEEEGTAPLQSISRQPPRTLRSVGTAGNPFSPDNAEEAAPKGPSASETTAPSKRKAGEALTKNSGTSNPFAPSSFEDREPRLSSISSAQPPLKPSPKNPFANPDAAPRRDRTADITTITVQSGGEKDHVFRITQLEHREASLRSLAVGDGLVIAVTTQTSSGESVLSRREIGALGKVDGSINMKDAIDNIFVDPACTHALICVKGNRASAQNEVIFYLSPQEAVLKAKGPLSALAGLSTVAWFEDKNDFAALVGTQSGMVQIARFAHNGISELKPLFSGDGKSLDRIVCILVNSASYMLLIDCNGALCFVGWDGQIVSRGVIDSPQRNSPKLEVISGINGSENDFWCISRKGVHRIWLDHVSKEARSELIYEVEGCFSIVQTRLHVLIMARVANKQSSVVSVRLFAISKITKTANIHLDKAKITVHGSAPLGFAKDETRQHVYIVSEHGAASVEIVDETKGAWSLYLKRALEGVGSEQDFAFALQYAERQEDKDAIRSMQGDWYLSNQRYVDAGRLFAATSNAVKPFEEVALTLASPNIGDVTEDLDMLRQRKKALRIFLIGRLERLPEFKSTLRTMLCTWICEAFLNELDHAPAPVKSSTTLMEESKAADDEREDIEGEFCAFLGQHASTLEPAKEVVFHLILSHGRWEMLLVYAYLTNDYDRVVRHHLQRNSPLEAVRAIMDRSQEDKEKATQLLYKYSSTLFPLCPEAILNAWLNLDNFLEPIKLITAIIKFEEQSSLRPFAITYLEHCVKTRGSREEALHNALLVAYSTDADALTTFITEQANQPGGFCFDAGLALRLCENVSPKTKIVLLDVMGMPEAACTAALDTGMLELAQRIASDQVRNRGNLDLGKRLWLMCCKHVLSSSSESLESALRVMHASDGAILVEDILQILPDSLKLDDTRDEVCVALERYNTDIERLKEEMIEHLESDNALRKDAREEKRRFDVIKASKRCDSCRKPIFVDNNEGEALPAADVDEFYVFPCTHIFHTKCLCSRLPQLIQDKAYGLLRSPSEADQALAEDLIGASCPLCGDLMIETIAQPLIFAKDEGQARRWDVTPRTNE